MTPEETASRAALIAAMTPEQKKARAVEMRARLKARRNKAGFEENVRDMETELAALEAEA